MTAASTVYALEVHVNAIQDLKVKTVPRISAHTTIAITTVRVCMGVVFVCQATKVSSATWCKGVHWDVRDMVNASTVDVTAMLRGWEKIAIPRPSVHGTVRNVACACVARVNANPVLRVQRVKQQQSKKKLRHKKTKTPQSRPLCLLLSMCRRVVVQIVPTMANACTANVFAIPCGAISTVQNFFHLPALLVKPAIQIHCVPAVVFVPRKVCAVATQVLVVPIVPFH